MSFIEYPRFPENISYSSSGGASFSTTVVSVSSGFKSKNQDWDQALHEYDARKGVIGPDEFAELKSFFMVVAGKYGAFRFKDWSDYKSCNFNAAVSALDQDIGEGDGSTVAFQLIKNYTFGSLTHERIIKKPVTGTVVIAIDDAEQSTGWSVDTTTGIVSFDADNQISATDADTTNPAELTFTGHGLSTGDTVYLSGFTGDWSVLNDTRYSVTVTGTDTFTVAVDATGFTAYSSDGGQMNTIPQTGEMITAGYEFDVPVECGTDLMLSSWDNFQIQSVSLPLIEVRL